MSPTIHPTHNHPPLYLSPTRNFMFQVSDRLSRRGIWIIQAVGKWYRLPQSMCLLRIFFNLARRNPAKSWIRNLRCLMWRFRGSFWIRVQASGSRCYKLRLAAIQKAKHSKMHLRITTTTNDHSQIKRIIIILQKREKLSNQKNLHQKVTKKQQKWELWMPRRLRNLSQIICLKRQ